MMTVEGVARRIYPDHDIWSAAEPVVRRWIARELSPVTRVRRLAEEAERAVRNLAHLAADPPTPRGTVVVRERARDRTAVLWAIIGALAATVAILAAQAWPGL